MDIKEIANLPDVSEGLEFTIKNAVNSCNNIYDILNKIKSKRYTQSRIQRILLYSLLDITKNDMKISKDIIPYVRVLGFNNNGKKLISEIYKRNPNINMITSVKKFVTSNTDKSLKLLLNKDVFATNVYTLGFEKTSLSNLDFTNDIIKFKP